jgi:hypothetical protein
MKDIVDLVRKRDNISEQISQYYSKRDKEGLTGTEAFVLEDMERELRLTEKEIEKDSCAQKQ